MVFLHLFVIWMKLGWPDCLEFAISEFQVKGKEETAYNGSIGAALYGQVKQFEQIKQFLKSVQIRMIFKYGNY